MPTRKITLKDGTEIDVTSCGAAGTGPLWIELAATFAEAADLFGDPEATAEITVEYNDPVTFTGYTDLFFVQADRDGTAIVGIRKGAPAE